MQRQLKYVYLISVSMNFEFCVMHCIPYIYVMPTCKIMFNVKKTLHLLNKYLHIKIHMNLYFMCEVLELL